MTSRRPLIIVVIILTHCWACRGSDEGETPMNKVDEEPTVEIAVGPLEQVSLSIQKFFTRGMLEFNEAHRLKEQGKYTQAIEYYKKAIETCKDNHDRQLIHLARADCYMKMRRLDEAISDYREVLKLGADFQNSRIVLIGLLFKEAKIEEAIAEFKLLDPNEYLEELLSKLCSVPQFQEDVLRMCDEGKTEKLEKNTYYYSGLADCCMKTGDPDSAIWNWRKALKFNPKYQKIRLLLIKELLNFEKYEDVVDEALLAESSYDFKSLGKKLFSSRAFDAAIRLYTELLKKNPDDKEVVICYYDGRAQCYKEKGDLNDAISDWQNALILSAYREDIWWRLIGVLVDTGKYKEAVVEAINGRRNNRKDMKKLASKLCTLKAVKEVLQLYEKIFEYSMYGDNYYKNIGKCYIRMGELDKARSNFKIACKKSWFQRSDCAFFCMALLKFGKIDDALEEFSRLDLSLFKSFELEQLGDKFLEKKIFNESHVSYTKAIENAYAEEIYIYYRKRGIYYKTVNEIPKAIQDFQIGCQIERIGSECCVELVEIFLEAGEYERAGKVLGQIRSEEYMTSDYVRRFHKARENIKNWRRNMTPENGVNKN